MQTAYEVLIALADRYAFGEVAALVGQGADGDRLTTRDAVRIQQLCAFGQRLFDLDAEDFAVPEAATSGSHGIPPELVTRALACRMPQAPGERHRGALGSLRPAYRLLLEVIDAHWRRRETTALVAAVHIASEYAPLLAWEAVLGHAGDPARLPDAVDGSGSAWGDHDDPSCAHTRAEKSAAQRALRVAADSASGWRTYLDRQHSNTSHALGVCAAECERPCTVLTRLSKEDEATVTDGSRLALAFVGSPIVRLRHSAPVGHGFGVPSPDEVSQAWQRTREALGRQAPAVLADDGFPLPGLTALFATIAGAPMLPDTLLADTATAVVAALTA
ncbi:hypothetical protein [Micromonospora sp. NPDC049679]|uniref:hypothetical protein n=1 Tax=Micromonospora sp. NPDC049679 TaxID=3155920 RepID=UPI00340AD71A